MRIGKHSNGPTQRWQMICCEHADCARNIRDCIAAYSAPTHLTYPRSTLHRTIGPPCTCDPSRTFRPWPDPIRPTFSSSRRAITWTLVTTACAPPAQRQPAPCRCGRRGPSPVWTSTGRRTRCTIRRPATRKRCARVRCTCRNRRAQRTQPN